MDAALPARDNNVTDVDRISEVAITALTGQAPAQVFERPSLLAAVDDAALAAAAARMTGWASRLGTRTIGDDLTVSLLGGHLNGLVSRISTGFLVPLHLSWTDLGLLYAADPNSTARPPVGLFCDVAGAYAGTLVGQVPDGTWTGSIDRFGVFSGTFVDSSGASSGSGTSPLLRVGLGDIRAAGVFEFGKVEGIAQVSSTAVLVNGFSQALLTTITGRRTSSDPACT